MTYKVPESEIAASPKVKLGGEEFAVPMLAARQQRIVVPAMIAIMPSLGRIFAALETNDAGAMVDLGFDGVVYDKILDAVYTGLTRARPDLTKDEFLDRQMSVKEVFAALQVVMLQTGMLDMKEPSAAGEAPAGSPQTSTP